jgi:hypothetical protein
MIYFVLVRLEVETMPIYPDWVTYYRTPGTSVKKVGEAYYLYKTTSVRVPGMKNPQPRSEYIGLITREGVKKTGVRKLPVQTCRVYEYGFSNVLEQLWPERISREIGDECKARHIFLNVVMKYSDRSYLLRDVHLPTLEELHICVCAYEKKFERLAGVSLKSLLPLSRIYLVEVGGAEIISETDATLCELMKGMGVSL